VEINLYIKVAPSKLFCPNFSEALMFIMTVLP
jgi:hypothetical protein